MPYKVTRKAVLLLASLLLTASMATLAQKQRPRSNNDVLFNKSDYIKTAGWRLLCRSDSDASGKHVLIYYDVTRVTRIGGKIVQAWIKAEEKNGNSLVSQTKVLDEYNCAARRSRYLQVAEYDQNGDPVLTYSEASEWTHITPDSVNERKFNVICLGKPDLHEEEMRAADRFFRLGRQQEKRGHLKQAHDSYLDALWYVPKNFKADKVIIALARTKDVDPR